MSRPHVGYKNVKQSRVTVVFRNGTLCLHTRQQRTLLPDRNKMAPTPVAAFNMMNAGNYAMCLTLPRKTTMQIYHTKVGTVQAVRLWLESTPGFKL